MTTAHRIPGIYSGQRISIETGPAVLNEPGRGNSHNEYQALLPSLSYHPSNVSDIIRVLCRELPKLIEILGRFACMAVHEH